VWAGWLFSQEWWRQALWRSDTSMGRSAEEVIAGIVRGFTDSIDANDMILQARVWEHHDIGTTPGYGGDVARALAAIRVPVLYMPSETDLYFPSTSGNLSGRSRSPRSTRCGATPRAPARAPPTSRT